MFSKKELWLYLKRYLPVIVCVSIMTRRSQSTSLLLSRIKFVECNKVGNLNIQVLQYEMGTFTVMLSYGSFCGLKSNRHQMRAKKGYFMIGYIKMDLGIAKYRFEIGTEEINSYWV